MKATFVLALLFTAASANATDKPKAKMPLVFINGSGATFITSGSVGKHDETMEMARNLLKSCPEISVTLKEESEPDPDYELLLNRQEEYGFVFKSAISQVMLLRGSDKVVLYSNKKGTVAKAVREGCKAILADWKDRSATPAAPVAAGDWWQPGKTKEENSK